MSSKRRADEVGGVRQFKQTKLNFGSKPVQEGKPAEKEDTENSPKVVTTSPEDIPQDDTHQSLNELAATTTPSEAQILAKEGSDKRVTTNGFVHVTEQAGDMFAAPSNSVLIHACNCAGNWGAGIAAAFKRKYPEAHKIHLSFCKSKTMEGLIGTAQLIPPSERSEAPPHYIGCLFTSRRFGRAKDTPDQILSATGPAMEDLLRQIKQTVDNGQIISEIRMCRINSGLFAVPWKETREAISRIESEAPVDIVAWERTE